MAVAINNAKTRDADRLYLSARLDAVIRRDEPGYVVYCPVLDICTHGNTIAEAKKYIAEATECFLMGCYQMGTLDEVLSDCGFRFPGQKRKARKKRVRSLGGKWDKRFRFSAKVALTVV